VETRALDTVLLIYYYSIGVKDICLDAEAVKTSNVALLKPAPVRVYDYYDSCEFEISSYKIHDNSPFVFLFSSKTSQKVL
jgi:A-macroglobulin receptor binding domain